MLILLTLVLGLLVSGCATPSQVLVNPETGQGYRCAHSGGGWGIMGAVAIGMTYANQSQCVQAMKQMGYVEIETLAGTGLWYDGREPLKEAIITKVTLNSPAHKAGVKVGDKIIEKNSQSIKCVGDLISTGRLQIGERVIYKMDRSGEILVFELVAVPFISLQK
jgi:hypothetical protein